MQQTEVEQLRTVLSSGDSREKLSQLKQFVPTRDPRIADCIIPLVGNETDPAVKRAMIQCIGIAGKPAHLKQILKLTEDPDPKIRISIAKAIITMGHGSFFPFLVRFLSDDDRDIKAFCGEELTNLGTEKLTTLLQSMWDIDLPWMKLSAIKAARQFKSADLVALLKKGLASEDPELKEEAQKGIERLARFGISEARELLEELSPSKKPDNHKSAAFDDGSLPRTTNSDRRQISESHNNDQYARAVKNCSNCAKEINEDALKCKYCRTIFDKDALNAILREAAPGSKPRYYPSIGAIRVAAYMLDSFPVMLISIIPFIGSSIGGAYMVLRDGIFEGQFTFKRLAKLKVIDVTTGNPATVNQSIIRNCAYLPAALSFVALVPIAGIASLALMALFTAPLFMIDCLMVLFSRRRISDRIANTTVVHDENIKDVPIWAKVVILLLSFMPILLVGGIFIITLLFASLAG
jgi:hypothetical protein